MASRTSIINGAVTLLSEQLIANENENSKVARYAKINYDDTRDWLLKRFTWNFATRRRTLNRSDSPDWGFQYAYALPEDCLRVVKTRDQIENPEDPEPWKIESRVLLTDAAECGIVYIRRVDREGEFDPMFVEVMKARLAYVLAPSFSEEQGKIESIYNLYQARVKEARSVDSFEGTPDAPIEGDWVYRRG